MTKFTDIIKYSEDNKQVYSDLHDHIKKGVISPFVGAGMSAHTYPTWKTFLIKVADSFDTEDIIDKYRSKINAKNADYETTASEMLAEKGKEGFNAIIRDTFKDHSDAINLNTQAIWLLPLLFNKLILTTNYDESLKNVYEQQGKYPHVILPKQIEAANSAMSGKLDNTIVMLHGNYFEPSSIILTKEVYTLEYDKIDGILKKELEKYYRNRVCLFLGCSLNNDRTLEILKETLEPGQQHFAILSCEKNLRSQRRRELGEMGILPIFYPPGQHTSVRIILESLLQDIDLPAYNGLAFRIGIGEITPTHFRYDEGNINFYGREKELEQLLKFCSDSPSNTSIWWAITGPGGCGKSRLAYELKRNLEKENWTIHWIGHEGLQQFHHQPQGNTLYIFDYVQGMQNNLSEWLTTLVDEKSGHLHRVLFIEREGTSCSDAKWYTLLKDSCKSSHLTERCYNTEFLNLQPLDKTNLKSLMVNYARSLNSELTDEESENLYNKLSAIDPKFTRPLYALFLVSAWNDTKDALKWDRKQVLDYVVERERKIIENNISHLFPNEDQLTDKLIKKSCIKIKCMATLLNDGINFSEIEIFCKKYIDTIKNKRQCELEECLAFIQNISAMDVVDNVISPISPDLIGEYFVLKNGLNTSDPEWKETINLAWKKPDNAAAFFRKLILDYNSLLLDSELLAGIIDTGYEISERDQETAIACSSFLFHLIIDLEQPSSIDNLEKIKELHNKYRNNTYISTMYSFSLTELIINSSETDNTREDYANSCYELYTENPYDNNIAFSSIISLGVLVRVQNWRNSIRTLKKMHKIYRRHKNSIEIVENYATCLPIILKNLGDVNSTKDKDNIFTQLNKRYYAIKTNKHHYKLYLKNSTNEIIRESYAQGLIISLKNNDHYEKKKTTDKLFTLYEEDTNNVEMAILYAWGLVLQLEIKDAQNRTNMLDTLKQIYYKFSDNVDIASPYVKGLSYVLANEKDSELATDYLNSIKEVQSRFPDEENIVNVLDGITC